MLVQYTRISSLPSGELQALKSVIMSGIQLEGRQHFEFGGKTFSVAEILQQKRVWEAAAQPTAPRQQLNG